MVCSNCGKEEEERWMHQFNIGRKTEWMCHECYKQGQREANLNDKRRSNRIDKLMKQKKRSGQL